MAKGDRNRSQSTINTQGGIAQNNLNQLGGDLNYLSYGGTNGQSYNTTPNSPNQGQQPRIAGGIFRPAGETGPPRVEYGPSTGGGKTNPITDVGQFERVFMSMVQGLPPTRESLESLRPQLAKMGATLIPNADGTKYDIRLADGRYIDAVYAFGDPNVANRRWQVLDDGYPESGQGSGQGGSPGAIGGLQNALGGYNQFAQTGGYSQQDIQNIRNRAMAPIRSLYSLGESELIRGRNLSGGYMPNFAPALARMQRQRNYALGDMGVDLEARLADAIRSGRLAGLAGLSQLGLGIGQQRLGHAGLQNQLSLGLIGAQQDQSQIPTDFNQGLANVGQVMGFFNPMNWF